MTFKVGDTVVYPHHGAALIEAVEVRVIKGAEKEYLVLRVAQGDLTVRVPADNVDLVGVRDVVNAEGLDRVFEVLRQPYTEEPTNWSRRYKANLEKLASGDVIKVGAKPSSQQLVIRMTDLTQSMPSCDWLNVDKDKLEATVSRVPERSDIDPVVNEQLIVEFYSRF